MPPPVSRIHEMVLPARAMPLLRQALAAEVGPDAAAFALRRAGHLSGDTFHALLVQADRLGETSDAPPAETTGEPDGGGGPGDGGIARNRFWQIMAELFAARGWGRLTHESVHPGVGALDTPDWAEADPIGGDLRPSCAFTTGLFASLLSRMAGEPVAVLEVECRSRGDLRCRFLFGGRSTLDRVHAALASGLDSDAALAELG